MFLRSTTYTLTMAAFAVASVSNLFAPTGRCKNPSVSLWVYIQLPLSVVALSFLLKEFSVRSRRLRPAESMTAAGLALAVVGIAATAAFLVLPRV